MLLDIYLLKEDFEKRDITLFINNYIKGMISTVDYYEYPQYSENNQFETDSFQNMLNFILEKKGRYFRFYFRNNSIDEDIKFGMIFFNKDNSLILGISIPILTKDYYRECLVQDFDSEFILECYEVVPPNNVKDFKNEFSTSQYLYKRR